MSRLPRRPQAPKSGKVHRYYACSTAARQGRTGCKTGQSIPVDRLDALVTGKLVESLFQPERLAELLARVCAQHADRQVAADLRATKLQAEVSDAEEQLRRLSKLVAQGLTEMD